MNELYDYCIWGNHEWDLAPLIAPGVSRRRLHVLHPAEHIMTIEGVKIRFSHYINAIASARSIPPYLDDVLQRVYADYCGRGWQVVVYGHTHRARHDVYRGVHFVDVGDGANGDYCFIEADSRDMKIKMRLGK